MALGEAMLSPVTVETTELTLPSRIEAIDEAATAVADLLAAQALARKPHLELIWRSVRPWQTR